MDSQTEKLIAKYWRGETSVAEEKLIREYFKKHPDQSAESQYFGKVNALQYVHPDEKFEHPGKSRRLAWLSVAAAILILLMSIPFFFNNSEPSDQFAVEDPREAFEITRASLLMVSNGLNKGKTVSNELVKFDEAKGRIEKR